MEQKTKMTRNRYSLVVQTEQEKNYIPIKQYDRQSQTLISGKKAELFILDSRTTDFRNYEELGDYLYEQNLIGFPVEKPEEVYIEYQSNGPKKLEIAYAIDREIKYFANQLKKAYQQTSYTPFQKKISPTDPRWNKIVDQFLNNLQQKDFFQYIKPYLNEKILKDLNSHYLKAPKLDTQFTKRIISQEISYYKTLRGILIATRNYQDKHNQDLEKWEEQKQVLTKTGLEYLLEIYDLDQIITQFPEIIDPPIPKQNKI